MLPHLAESVAVPWFLPGAALFVAMAIAGGRRTGRALGVGPLVAQGLIVSIGIVLAVTLTPLRGVLELGAVGSGHCDLSRIGPAPLRELLTVNDTSLNVLLFVPLGATLAFLPRTRRTALVVAAAIALPFAIEATQLLVPWLDRACESADVVDNLTGLAIGLAGGVVAARLAAALDRRPR